MAEQQMRPHLTQRQLVVLNELQKPGAMAIYMRYRLSLQSRDYWYLSKTLRRCTREIERLMALGLVTRKRKVGGDLFAVISELGKAQLKDEAGEIDAEG